MLSNSQETIRKPEFHVLKLSQNIKILSIFLLCIIVSLIFFDYKMRKIKQIKNQETQTVFHDDMMSKEIRLKQSKISKNLLYKANDMIHKIQDNTEKFTNKMIKDEANQFELEDSLENNYLENNYLENNQLANNPIESNQLESPKVQLNQIELLEENISIPNINSEEMKKLEAVKPKDNLKRAVKKAMSVKRSHVNNKLRPLSEEKKDKNLNNNPKTCIERIGISERKTIGY